MSSNIVHSIESIKQAIAQISGPQAPELKALTSDILENGGKERGLMRSTAEPPIEIEKKSVQFLFKGPVFVHELTIQTKGPIIKSIKLLLNGAPGEKQSREVGKIFPGAAEKFQVDAIIYGFELISSKRIGDRLSYVEIVGAEGVAVANILGVREQLSQQAEDLKTYMGAELDRLSRLSSEVDQKISANSSLEQEIKAKEEQTMTAQQEADRLDKSLAEKVVLVRLQEKEKDELSKDILTRHGSIDELQIKASELRTQISAESLDIAKLRGEKSLYNETLKGHKEETTKQIVINLVLMAGILLVALVTVGAAFWLVHEAIAEVKSITDAEKMRTLLAIRLGASALFGVILRYSFVSFNRIFNKTYNLVADRRAIEGKLILARSIAESCLNKLDVSDDEKRNYASFLAFSVLKNHFLNMSLDSLADDLDIQPGKLERQLPRLPARYAQEAFISDFTKKSANAADVASEKPQVEH